jgi:hypothetical protein
VSGGTVLAWLHLVLGVVVTGFALFWAIMGRALSRGAEAAEAPRLLAVAASARWPHVVVPWSARLPLPLLGIVVLAVAAVTGVLLGTPGTLVSGLKVVAVVALLVCFRQIGRQPTAALGYAGLALALVIMALSTMMAR